MSLVSMTGYGSGRARGAGCSLTVELWGVNRKQLDINLSLPRPIAGLESRVAERIRSAVNRGRVRGEIRLQCSNRLRQAAVRLDEPLARAYVERLRELARKLGLNDDLTVRDLLGLPDVIVAGEVEIDTQTVAPVLERAVDRALRAFNAMRRQEGRTLQQDLESRLAELGRLRQSINDRAPGAREEYRNSLRRRLEEAGAKIDSQNDDRLFRELVFFAERSDVSEELIRLRSHLKQARILMRGREPAGRRLDFLAQEMFREINTIGSKSADAQISRFVVLSKAELDRIREQVQNIE